VDWYLNKSAEETRSYNQETTEKQASTFPMRNKWKLVEFRLQDDTSKLCTILGILMDAKLQVLSEGLIKLGIIFLVLCNLIEQLYALFHNVLSDNLQFHKKYCETSF
jgi:hypothetical protein